MKVLISVALTMLLSTASFAKGVGSIKVNENLDAKKQHVALALEVDEAIVGPMAYHSYSAIGDNKLGGDGFTFKTSHQLDFDIKKFTLSPGASLYYVSEAKKSEKEVFVKLGYQLW